jgi:hypothetical protein
MIVKSTLTKLCKMVLIVCASVVASAQTHAAERAFFPQRGSESYWLLVDQFADSAVNFAYATHVVRVHEGPLTERQCQQYSRVAVEFAQQLSIVRRTGVSAHNEFWKDVRTYSVSMIGAPGVPIPGDRISKYRVTTGSEAEDRELRQIVWFEIEESRSHMTRTAEYSPSAQKLHCGAAQELTATIEH